ncbi:quercetin dioxygenase-like cupin family protein [Bradyrhizobium sp. USDA 4341]
MRGKHTVGPPVSKLASVIARQLRELTEPKATPGRGLKALADRAGVDPKQLKAIANGEKMPSLCELWKIANALGVPFGALIAKPRRGEVLVIRKSDDNTLESSNGAFRSRPLTAFGANPRVEIYELVIAPGHIETSQAHGSGTLENIVVSSGSLEVVVGREPPYRLEQGDAIHFQADVPHSYRNIGGEDAVAHLVLGYENYGV